MAAIEDRWRLLIELAWKGNGITVDISRVPLWILPKVTEWHQQLAAESNKQSSS